MNTLQQIIGSMNKEEVRHLKLFMGRTNAGEERKDTELFDYIRLHHNDYDEGRIQQKLYGDKDKNALYRLKNRLLEDIGKSLTLQYVEEQDFNQVAMQLILARHFFSRSQSQIALYYLQRAEKKAQAAESPELLDLVYGEFIRVSQESLNVNPAEYIKKRKANREQLHSIQEIDDVLAEVVYKVRTTQNFTGQDYKGIENLQKKVASFSKQKTARQSTALRFKIYQSISRILLQKQDFVSLEKYLIQTFDEFNKAKLFGRNNHETKLQMLTYLTNSLAKNGKHDESLKTANSLRTAMNEYGGHLHDKYLFFYYNALVVNYSQKDIRKGIEILEEAKENAVIQKLPFFIVFIYANLSVLNFDDGNYKLAIKNLVKLTMESGFENLDRSLRFNIAVAELIIRYEIGDFDFLERRIEQVKKEFSDLFRSRDFKRQQELVGILSTMINTPSVRRDKPLTKRIQKMLDSAGSKEAAENDIINYNNWLQQKIA
ncbi:MAG: hypothetical protein ACRCYO_17295 [Bacteroidia bacterium]